ncbi:MAG: YeeE/YedE family protein [Holophagales bacterium]|nr:YeeE/YedE family protein [Holophagales bacterium]
MSTASTHSDEARPASSSPTEPPASPRSLIVYLLIGTFFGVLLIKSEVVSWYRIQEMFRFQSIFMYGVLGSAFATAAVVIRGLPALGLRSLTGETISLSDKAWGPGARHRYWLGGMIFGLGWGLSGTCPGPIYALLGYGASGAVVVLASALAGARAYATLAEKLPH